MPAAEQQHQRQNDAHHRQRHDVRRRVVLARETTPGTNRPSSAATRSGPRRPGVPGRAEINSAPMMKSTPLMPPATSDGTLCAFTYPMIPAEHHDTPKMRK